MPPARAAGGGGRGGRLHKRRPRSSGDVPNSRDASIPTVGYMLPYSPSGGPVPPEGEPCAAAGDGPGAFKGPVTCPLPGTPASRLRGAPRTVFYAAESEGPWTSCAGQSRSARSWPGPCWTAPDTGAGPGAGTDARFSERRVAPLARVAACRSALHRHATLGRFVDPNADWHGVRPAMRGAPVRLDQMPVVYELETISDMSL